MDLMTQHLVNAGVIKQLEFVLLQAIPGAGKSTYVQTVLAKQYPNAAIICPDTFRKELTGSESDFSKDSFIWNTLIYTRMNGAMARRQPVIFDATSYRAKNRKGPIAHARELGYRIVVHVLRTPFEECVRRNGLRDRQVPYDVLVRMRDGWQEPALSEGIDEIVEVDTSKPLDTLPQVGES